MFTRNLSTKIVLTVSSLVLLSGCCSKKKAHALGDLPREFAVAVKDRVHFDFDSSNLSQESKDTLDKQAAWILNHNFGRYSVAGHADERGTREYNLALGERRANSVKKYLVSRGIDPKIISTVSFGKEKPLALGHDEESWTQNRRAVTSHKLSAAPEGEKAPKVHPAKKATKPKFKSKVGQKAYEHAIKAEEATKHKASQAKEAAKEKASQAKEAVKEKVHDAAEAVEQKAQDVKEATTPNTNE
ncbi:outer membrane lipoprotein omp16 [Candidatus Phycorickettsia trachydisci]|uniref:Peptidoglycan-associated lipoprotein n=1 Tax=Candidatus Phycorickettsia trachydisci TaxID=2115978 RepID=A0A2P1P739_9RICK|nr:peptidoglycan-associated lipoprotein Pal [Candidatus Phycorickettsia trachydisci]AVP87078.1 outer membrane lipoprotein omp16 [Candidatus Phycorickettsia trachydisci]